MDCTLDNTNVKFPKFGNDSGNYIYITYIILYSILHIKLHIYLKYI